LFWSFTKVDGSHPIALARLFYLPHRPRRQSRNYCALGHVADISTPRHDTTRHDYRVQATSAQEAPPAATMSDAGLDPALSDDDVVNDQAIPAGDADEGTPLNTVEENVLDEDDDLFGDGDVGDDAPAYVAMY